MRIALCLTGHVRSYVKTFPHWQENLLSQHNVDVFLSTWDTVGYRNTSGAILNNDSGVVGDTLININEVAGLWNPRSFELDVYNSFHEYFQRDSEVWCAIRIELGCRDIDRPLANFSQYYKWWKVNQMKCRMETLGNFKYDMVIRSRFDIALTGKLPESVFNDQSMLHIPKEGAYANDETPEISDFITIGTSKQMDMWADIYPQLSRKTYEAVFVHKDFTRVLHPHKLFHFHIVENGYQYVQDDIPCILIRDT